MQVDAQVILHEARARTVALAETYSMQMSGLTTCELSSALEIRPTMTFVKA